jgi:hypothetical protein
LSAFGKRGARRLLAGVIDLPVDSHKISFRTDRTKRFGAYEPENFNDDSATRGGGTISVRALPQTD